MHRCIPSGFRIFIAEPLFSIFQASLSLVPSDRQDCAHALAAAGRLPQFECKLFPVVKSCPIQATYPQAIVAGFSKAAANSYIEECSMDLALNSCSISFSDNTNAKSRAAFYSRRQAASFFQMGRVFKRAKSHEVQSQSCPFQDHARACIIRFHFVETSRSPQQRDANQSTKNCKEVDVRRRISSVPALDRHHQPVQAAEG